MFLIFGMKVAWYCSLKLIEPDFRKKILLSKKFVFFFSSKKLPPQKISLIKAEWCWFIVPRDTCFWCYYWTSESNRFCDITLVSPSLSNELISETALTIFLKLGMKLGDNKGKKWHSPIFEKNSHCGRFWPNVPKNGQNHSLWDFAKKWLEQNSKIAIKISPSFTG